MKVSFWKEVFRMNLTISIAPNSIIFLEAEELLKDLEKKQGVDMYSKNWDGLALHYHPDGVLIHKGVGAYYGRDGKSKILSYKLEFIWAACYSLKNIFELCRNFGS